MSYARFGWDDSDVYVYLDVSGYLACCGCRLLGDGWGRFYTTDDLFAHLERHAANGDVIPDATLDRLEEDREDNDAWIAEQIREACAALERKEREDKS